MLSVAAHQLQVGAVPERNQGVTRQAVGVLAAGRHRETQALVVPHSSREVGDQDHQMVQPGQHSLHLRARRH